VLAAGMQFVAVTAGTLLARTRAPREAAADAALDLQQDDHVDGKRERERDRPAVQVSLDK